jgi:hypothetical protein
MPMLALHKLSSGGVWLKILSKNVLFLRIRISYKFIAYIRTYFQESVICLNFLTIKGILGIPRWVMTIKMYTIWWQLQRELSRNNSYIVLSAKVCQPPTQS